MDIDWTTLLLGAVISQGFAIPTWLFIQPRIAIAMERRSDTRRHSRERQDSAYADLVARCVESPAQFVAERARRTSELVEPLLYFFISMIAVPTLLIGGFVFPFEDYQPYVLAVSLVVVFLMMLGMGFGVQQMVARARMLERLSISVAEGLETAADEASH